jgi:hypothetical protein
MKSGAISIRPAIASSTAKTPHSMFKAVIKLGMVNIFMILLNIFVTRTERCKFTFVFDEKIPFTQFFAKERVIL